MSVEELWTESKRPRTLDELSRRGGGGGPFDTFAEIHAILSHLLLNPSGIPPLAFQGPPGSGKTTTAMAFARALCRTSQERCRAEDGLEGRILRINGSEERRSQTLAYLVGEFVRRSPLPDPLARRVVFVDEADGMPPHSQDLLFIYMDEAQRIGACCFILAFNDASKISERLTSRCHAIRFPGLDRERSAEIIRDVIPSEIAHKFDETAIRQVVGCGEGDMRASINLAFRLAYGTPEDHRISPQDVHVHADLSDRQAVKIAFAELLEDPRREGQAWAFVASLTGAFDRLRDFELILLWMEELVCEMLERFPKFRLACLAAIADCNMRISFGGAATTLQVQSLALKIARVLSGFRN